MRTSRRSAVDSFIVMDVMEAARAAEATGQDVIHMEVGQPGTPAPKLARDGLNRAMEAGPLGYTVALGLPALRERIARHYGEVYGVDVAPSRIVVTSGSSAGFILSFLSLFDAGQRVGIADPGYPSYRNILGALDLQAVRIEGTVANRFQPTVADITPDLDGLLVASPANPTGSMLDRAALGALVQACEAADVALISDEIYHGIEYEGRAVTALELTDDVFVINSFSKYFSMTGWRIGWMVVPDSHVRVLERLAQNLFICPPHASQIAALHAMDAGQELDENAKVYARNRAVLLDALPKAGLRDIAPPDGAFYIYANIAHTGLDSRSFTARLLAEEGVAATPGLDFDPVRGHETVRFSYAGPSAAIAEGAVRIARFMASLSDSAQKE
ncbi:pyridoxal phosphate-dependent aminotransferase [Pontivivens nitratireducens]|uniref:Aminotransferase n=1 Tax=Pontivivens nitratireducens TaxID=2758038 RepID=A0A6G7VNH2_9RHOB|nr:aminotransferase class I/II-fold pyridoxal phosphate-dependent enzyme [Pontibrevibacter nitratireducens]QIK41415.1 aminotransferase class I/II-fold pyridoxal phosphate-dependent enzyme [Pontibrevibacter nitratireducens]